jgi:hypothetical protein
MGKLIIFLSFLSLGFLLTLSFIAPNAPEMWMASAATGYNVLRAALMVILLALLVTNPPRNVYFRCFVGLIAIALGAWSIWSTYEDHLQLFDTVSILAASVSMGIAVLEYNPAADAPTIIRREEPVAFSGFSSNV